MEAKEFNSGAFEANKYLTRAVNDKLPEEHEKFLEISKSYWGINNAAKEFLKEFNHPYSNLKFPQPAHQKNCSRQYLAV